MIIESKKVTLRVRLGHQDCGSAVPTAHVGYSCAALKFFFHAIQGRNPLGRKMRDIAGPKKPLRALEQSGAVLMPSDPLAGLKGVAHLGFVQHDRADDLKRTRDEARAALLRQRHGLFRWQRESVRRRVVGHIAARGLRRKPLPNVTRKCAGLFRELFRRQRPGAGHRLVEPEFIAQENQCRVESRTHVAHCLPHKRVQLRFVDRRICAHIPGGWLRF